MKAVVIFLPLGLVLASALMIGTCSTQNAEHAQPIVAARESPLGDPENSQRSVVALEPANGSSRQAAEATDPVVDVSEPVTPSGTTGPPQGLSPEDVQALRDNLDRLYGNASREVLVDGYKDCRARLPKGLTSALHRAHIDVGNYEVLDVPPVKPGEPFRVPRVKASPIAPGLVGVTPLEDGRVVKTVLDLDELGIHAATAVELGWFELAIARARRAERE